MPASIVIKSGICPSHYWNLHHAKSVSCWTDIYGRPYSDNGNYLLETAQSESFAITHDSALGTGVVGTHGYIDSSWTSGGGLTQTPHTDIYGTGGTASITIPTFDSSWGSLKSVDIRLAGDVTITHTINTSDFCTPTCKLAPSSPFGPAMLGVAPASASGNAWQFLEGWSDYSHTLNRLVNGREPFVIRNRYVPTDSIYRFAFQAYDMTGAAEGFHFTNETEVDGWPGGLSIDGQGYTYLAPNWQPVLMPFVGAGLVGWLTANQGTTQTLQFVLIPEAVMLNNGTSQWAKSGTANGVPSNSPITITESTDLRFNLLSAQCIIRLNFDGSADVKTGGNPVAMDTYGDFIAAAWVGDADTKSGKKQLYVGVQSALTRNIGSGSGATGGWDSYLYGDVDNRAEVGLVYLPNGNLVLSFDDYSGGTKQKRYTVNRSYGRGPLANWDTPAALTADGSGTNGVGRALGQAWKFRVGG